MEMFAAKVQNFTKATPNARFQGLLKFLNTCAVPDRIQLGLPNLSLVPLQSKWDLSFHPADDIGIDPHLKLT